MLISSTMSRRFVLAFFSACVLLLARAQDPASWSNAQKEHFLLTATIESAQYAGKGITNSQKAMLSDGKVEHAAHIQHIDLYMPLFKGRDGSQEEDFHDTWKYNVAAYRLAKMLGLGSMVPACVARVVDGKPASISWWIDNVLMDEKERVSKNIQPPDPVRWRHQMDTIRVFDQLIYNMDRSQENLVITKDWQVWMIDHTRTFRKWTSLRNPAAITQCSPELLAALKRLRKDEVTRQIGEFVPPEVIDGMMVRRDLIVQRLEANMGLSR